MSKDQVTQVKNQLFSQALGAFSWLLPFLTGLFSNVIGFISVVTLSVYFAIDGPRIIRWLSIKTPATRRETINFLLHALDESLGRYCRRAGVAACPYAALLGVFFFLLFFLQVIGSWVIEALCILAAFPLGWVTMLIAGCYLTFLQGDVIGLILAPRIFSKAVGVHPIVAFFALFAGENSLDSSEGCFQSLLPMCSSRSSWLSGTGGNRSIPINSRQKRCLLNNKQKFHASPNTFLHTLRLCCECTGGFYSRGDSVPFVITCQALSCTQVVGADAHPGPWVRFPG